MKRKMSRFGLRSKAEQTKLSEQKDKSTSLANALKTSTKKGDSKKSYKNCASLKGPTQQATPTIPAKIKPQIENDEPDEQLRDGRISIICSLPLSRLSGIIEKLSIKVTPQKQQHDTALFSEKHFSKPPNQTQSTNSIDQCGADGGDDEDGGADEKPLSSLFDDDTSNSKSQDQEEIMIKTLCLYCDKQFGTQKMQKKHIEKFHSPQKDRRCSGRNSQVLASPRSKSANRQSAVNRMSKNYPGCTYCKKLKSHESTDPVQDFNGLFLHLTEQHADKYFGCKICVMRFQNIGKLIKHMQSVHNTLPEAQLKLSKDYDVSDETRIEPDSPPSPSTDKPQQQQQHQQIKQKRHSRREHESPASSSLLDQTDVIGAEDTILTRLGLTQNRRRMPSNRKGVRLRRDTAMPDMLLKSEALMSSSAASALLAASSPSKSRNKVTTKSSNNAGSSDPDVVVFRVPARTSDALSTIFDEHFYKEVTANVRNNLLYHLDGKLEETPNRHTMEQCNEQLPSSSQTKSSLPLLLRSTLAPTVTALDAESNLQETEIHVATNLSATTAFPTLLTTEQYCGDVRKIRRPHTKHSWKWKWDSVKKYKLINEGGKMVKKAKHPMLGLRDLSKLDMWTQLSMRQKHEKQLLALQHASNFDDLPSGEKRRLNDQLNAILDTRVLPHIILEQSEQAIIKMENDDFHYSGASSARNMDGRDDDDFDASSIVGQTFADENFLSLLQLSPRSESRNQDRKLVLSGEWARPRCYMCMCCGNRFEKLKSLEEHKTFRHSNIFSTHYEVVGRELLAGNLLQYLFIPKRALSYYSAPPAVATVPSAKSMAGSAKKLMKYRRINVAAEEESSDSVQSVSNSYAPAQRAFSLKNVAAAVAACTTDDCDTDTKTTLLGDMNTVSPSHSLQSSFSSSLTTNSNQSGNGSGSSVSVGAGNCSSLQLKQIESNKEYTSRNWNCSKCSRKCNGMADLYRHMLDCSGDYIWSLAKKRKYRYYCGSKKRRHQLHRQHSSESRKNKSEKTSKTTQNIENCTTEESSSNSYKPKTPPRPRPSDAESIKKMLENLPPKRVCKTIFPTVNKAKKTKKPKFITKLYNTRILRTTRARQNSNKRLAAKAKKASQNKTLNAMKCRNRKNVCPTKQSSAAAAETNSEATTSTDADSKAGRESATPQTEKQSSYAKKEPTAAGLQQQVEHSAATNSDKHANNEEAEVNRQIPNRTASKSTTAKETQIENANDKMEAAKNASPTKDDTNVEAEVEARHEETSNATTNTDENEQQKGAKTLSQAADNGACNRKRSKRISDCIAMLTGKLEEKLKTESTTSTSISTSNSASTIVNVTAPVIAQAKNDESVESIESKTAVAEKEKKTPKRKTISRRIIKTDNVEPITDVPAVAAAVSMNVVVNTTAPVATTTLVVTTAATTLVTTHKTSKSVVATSATTTSTTTTKSTRGTAGGNAKVSTLKPLKESPLITAVPTNAPATVVLQASSIAPAAPNLVPIPMPLATALHGVPVPLKVLQSHLPVFLPPQNLQPPSVALPAQVPVPVSVAVPVPPAPTAAPALPLATLPLTSSSCSAAALLPSAPLALLPPPPLLQAHNSSTSHCSMEPLNLTSTKGAKKQTTAELRAQRPGLPARRQTICGFEARDLLNYNDMEPLDLSIKSRAPTVLQTAPSLPPPQAAEQPSPIKSKYMSLDFNAVAQQVTPLLTATKASLQAEEINVKPSASSNNIPQTKLAALPLPLLHTQTLPAIANATSTDAAIFNKQFYSNLELLKIPQIRAAGFLPSVEQLNTLANGLLNTGSGAVSITGALTPSPAAVPQLPTVAVPCSNANEILTPPQATQAPILLQSPVPQPQTPQPQLAATTAQTQPQPPAKTNNKKRNNSKSSNLDSVVAPQTPTSKTKESTAASKKESNAKQKALTKMDEVVNNHIDDAINSVINAVKASLYETEQLQQQQQMLLDNKSETPAKCVEITNQMPEIVTATAAAITTIMPPTTALIETLKTAIVTVEPTASTKTTKTTMATSAAIASTTTDAKLITSSTAIAVASTIEPIVSSATATATIVTTQAVDTESLTTKTAIAAPVIDEFIVASTAPTTVEAAAPSITITTTTSNEPLNTVTTTVASQDTITLTTTTSQDESSCDNLKRKIKPATTTTTQAVLTPTPTTTTTTQAPSKLRTTTAAEVETPKPTVTLTPKKRSLRSKTLDCRSQLKEAITKPSSPNRNELLSSPLPRLPAAKLTKKQENALQKQLAKAKALEQGQQAAEELKDSKNEPEKPKRAVEEPPPPAAKIENEPTKPKGKNKTANEAKKSNESCKANVEAVVKNPPLTTKAKAEVAKVEIVASTVTTDTSVNHVNLVTAEENISNMINNTSSGFHSSSTPENAGDVKPKRRRRKNELAAIVADQLLESFKIDKARRDSLKKLENMAYEKSEDLLITGMLLTSNTKRTASSAVSFNQNAEKRNIENAKRLKQQQQETVARPKSRMSKAVVANEQMASGTAAAPNTKSKVTSENATIEKQQETAAPVKTLTKAAVKVKQPQKIEETPSPVPTPVPTPARRGRPRRLTRRRGCNKTPLDNENLSKLKSSLESFSIGIEKQLTEFEARNTAAAATKATTSKKKQTKATTAAVEETAAAANSTATTTKPATNSYILRPSILAATLEQAQTATKDEATKSQKGNAATKNEKVQDTKPASTTKSAAVTTTGTAASSTTTTSTAATTYSRDPRLNKNIHKEENPPTANELKSQTSAIAAAPAICDIEDDNYLTEIAKNVNEKIMAAENEDFAFADDDGFEIGTEFNDDDDDDSNSKYSRPPTSMSVRSAPNFNDDHSNFGSICDDENTNTEVMDMDLDDELSVYTSFSQDLGRGRGRKRRRRRSILLKRRPKKRRSSQDLPAEKFECELCKKTFFAATSLAKHNMTLAHVSKVSEREYLMSRAGGKAALFNDDFASVFPKKRSTSTTAAARRKRAQSMNLEIYERPYFFNDEDDDDDDVGIVSKIDAKNKKAQKVQPVTNVVATTAVTTLRQKPPTPQSTIQTAPAAQLANQEMSSQRLSLNPDERLFYECCNILKSADTTRMATRTEQENDNQSSFLYPKSFAPPPPSLPSAIDTPATVAAAAAVLAHKVNAQTAHENQMNLLPMQFIEQKLQNSGHIEPPLLSTTKQPETSKTPVLRPSSLQKVLPQVGVIPTIERHTHSPTYSQFSAVTNTTQSRFKTKAAMKGYENGNIDLTIQTQEMKSRPTCKLTELADIALGHDDKPNAMPTTANLPTKINQTHVANTKRVITPEYVTMTVVGDVRKVDGSGNGGGGVGQFNASIMQDNNKKATTTAETQGSTSSKTIMHSSIIKAAVEEHGKVQAPKKIVIPERPFKNIGLEEKETITFQKPKTTAVNLLINDDDNSVSTASYSDRDDFDFNSMSCDEDGSVKNSNEKHLKSNSSDSSSSRATAKTFENKSLIMGRIFKNASTKAAKPAAVKSVGVQKDNTPKADLNQLFDELRGDARAVKVTSPELVHSAAKDVGVTAQSRDVFKTNVNKLNAIEAAVTKTTQETPKRKAAEKTEKKAPKKVAATTTSKQNKKPQKDMSKLQTELGMSQEEIEKLIDEGQRKSKRRCATNRAKKLVETWSSDEYEEFLSTKDIIALIEEQEKKEQRRKRKSSVGGSEINQKSLSAAPAESSTRKSAVSAAAAMSADLGKYDEERKSNKSIVAAVAATRERDNTRQNSVSIKESTTIIGVSGSGSTKTKPAKVKPMNEESASIVKTDLTPSSGKKTAKNPRHTSNRGRKVEVEEDDDVNEGQQEKEQPLKEKKKPVGKKTYAAKTVMPAGESSAAASDADDNLYLLDIKRNINNNINSTSSKKSNRTKRDKSAAVETATAASTAVAAKESMVRQAKEDVRVNVNSCKPQRSREREATEPTTNNLEILETTTQKKRNINAIAAGGSSTVIGIGGGNGSGNNNKKNKGKRKPQAEKSPARKRKAAEKLYYWSSSSDEEFGRINEHEPEFENTEQYQKHGWIVGDSHKKLVTLLAIAKGNKKQVENCGVKKNVSKRKN